MDGPVTHTRAQRGETAKHPRRMKLGWETGKSETMKNDGLKLRLELKLDREDEAKEESKGEVVLVLL